MEEEVQEIDLKLAVPEVNIILKVLAKHPFDEVASLIFKIKKQGDPQIAVIGNSNGDEE